MKYPVDGVSVITEDVLTTQPFASVTSKQYPFDVNQLWFYPTTPTSHNTAKQGDILPFSVISEIRGKGVVILNSYEYRQ